MRFLRIVVLRCIESWRREASRTQCYDWRTTGYAKAYPSHDKYERNANRFQNTHQQVKAKILERMGEWAEMFSKDPDLGIMEQAYTKLKSQSMSSNPHLSLAGPTR